MAPLVEVLPEFEVDAVKQKNPNEHNDDEWEYEYDDYETEDFYVMLDLTSHVPPRTNPYKGKRGGRVSVRNRHNVLGTSNSHPEKAPDPSDGVDSIINEPTRSPDAELNQASTQATDHLPNRVSEGSVKDEGMVSNFAQDRIQILDLHSDDVIVSYNGQAYRCSWAEALGTDLIFEHGAGAKDKPSALRSYADFNLIASTSTRLVGKPIKLVPRERSGDDSAASAVDKNLLKLQANQKQADFLTRFAALKATRGETDSVPLKGKKNKLRRTGSAIEEGSKADVEIFEVSHGNGTKSLADDDSAARDCEIVLQDSDPGTLWTNDQALTNKQVDILSQELGTRKRKTSHPSDESETIMSQGTNRANTQSELKMKAIGQANEENTATFPDSTPVSWDDVVLQQVVERIE